MASNYLEQVKKEAGIVKGVRRPNGYNPDRKKSAKFLHGMSKTPEYSTWNYIRNKQKQQRKLAPALRIPTDQRLFGPKCFRWFLLDVGLRPSPLHRLNLKQRHKGYVEDNMEWQKIPGIGRNPDKPRVPRSPVKVEGIVYKNIAAACRVIGISRPTVYRWMKEVPPRAVRISQKEYKLKMEKRERAEAIRDARITAARSVVPPEMNELASLERDRATGRYSIELLRYEIAQRLNDHCDVPTGAVVMHPRITNGLIKDT